MAISQSEYIDIATVINNDVVGSRDWSALIFTDKEMKTGASKKTDFETTKKVVTLTKSEITEQFDDATIIAACNRYFSYTGGTKTPNVINLAYVDTGTSESETALDAYNRITGGTTSVPAFTNFGSFAFIGSFSTGTAGSEGLLDVAVANNGHKFGRAMMYGTNMTNQSADSAALANQTLTHLTHDPVAAISWYASVDYDIANAAGTIDYKQFPSAVATVTTDSAKHTADNLKVNYIGQVQTYGNELSFYQTGVNMDGTDLGVVRDMCWINSRIVSAYFNLQANSQKIPASYVGAAMVRNIVVGAAVDAIAAGAILNDKPLTTEQIAEINQYANDSTAANTVSTDGYFVSTDITKQGNKYYCKYTLIYAKGDHIAKVTGSHYLV